MQAYAYNNLSESIISSIIYIYWSTHNTRNEHKTYTQHKYSIHTYGQTTKNADFMYLGDTAASKWSPSSSTHRKKSAPLTVYSTGCKRRNITPLCAADMLPSLYIVSHTACKDEFRRNLRSHSWSVFSFFII